MRIISHFKKVTLVLSIGLILSPIAAMQAVAQSFSFSAFEIEGNQRVEDGTILNIGGLSRGQSLSEGDLNAAAQRIRASGLFETVSVSPNRGTLTISVKEWPTINQISIEGNAKVSDAVIMGAVQSQLRRAYSPVQAERDTAAIADVYADKGRINAVVVPRIIRRSNNRVDLIFEVSESDVTEVERISFVGNRKFSEGRLRRVLETKQAGILRAIITRDTFVEERIAFDRRALTDFYQSRGYVDFEVQNVDVSLTRERDAFLVTFNVQEGQKYTIGNVSLRSEIPEADAAVFGDAIRLPKATVYSPSLIDREISRLERMATKMGVNFLQAEPRISRNGPKLELDIEFVLVRGPRIFVERIDIEGNNTTLDRVIRNQFRLVEGDPFNPREIRESAQRIRALGFFGSTNVEAREGSTPSQVVIDVDVQERPTGSLSFGANYSTDSGVRLIASFEQDNFLGRGQRLDFDLAVGETNRVFSVDFFEPQFLSRDLGFGLGLNYGTTDNDNALYDTSNINVRPTLSFPASENGRLSLFVGYDQTEISDVDANASQLIKDDDAAGAIGGGSAGYFYNFDSRRDGLDPNTGIVLRFGQEFGFGSSDYLKTTALAAAETKVMNEEVTLRATLEGGQLSYSDGASRITDRFFLGSRLMRGFEPSGVGPRDATSDDALGGNKFAVARLEAEFPLGLPDEYGISGGVFFDYGSVWDIGRTAPAGTTVIYDGYTPRAVVGMSLFWTTPLGPLRFNFTEALDKQAADNVRDFDVTISTSF